MVEGVNRIGQTPDVTQSGGGKQPDNGKITINFNNGLKGETTLTVTKGMTLSELAIKYNTTVEDIVNANGLTSTDISAGQSLKIPLNTASEELQAKRRHNARMDAEQKELENKGIKDPAERAKYLMAKDIESGRLKWVPEEEVLFGLIKTGGFYEYNTEDEGLYGAETYGEVKARYGLKDGKIKRGNYIPGGGNLDEAGIYDRKLKLYPEDMPAQEEK